MALAGKKRLAHIRTEKTIPITASKTAKRVAHTPTVSAYLEIIGEGKERLI